MVGYIADSSDLRQNKGFLYPFMLLLQVVLRYTFDSGNPAETKNVNHTQPVLLRWMLISLY